MSLSESAIMALANFSPRGVDSIVKNLAQNKHIYSYIKKLTQKTLGSIKRLDRVLVVSDTNIGDAIVIQSVIQILKYYFPTSVIDYVYQQKAQPLINKNPYIDNDLPIFIDSDFTSTKNRTAIEEVVTESNYDLIINLYPFFSNCALTSVQCPILTPFKLVADIVKTNSSSVETSNVLYQLNKYINGIIRFLPEKLRRQKKKYSFSGNTIYLSHEVIRKTMRLMNSLNIPFNAKLIFLNPDTSSRYTKIPIKLQVELLKKILSLNNFDFILLGPGFTFKGIEQEIYYQIPPSLSEGKIIVLPDAIGIDEYSGFIDRSHIFITGDTAQMHIAAAYKVCVGSKNHFRNKTVLISLFGATNSKIHGYDSFSEYHIAANQQAPSKVFEGNPSCKNLTCIHKTRKRCTKVKCFDGIQLNKIIEYITRNPLSMKV